MRLTDRNAIKIALFLALDTEDATLDAYTNQIDGKIDEHEQGVIIARQRIAAFKRVLDRYFEGARTPKLPSGKRISLMDLLKLPPQQFDPGQDVTDA